jgi:hypothetical protein
MFRSLKKAESWFVIWMNIPEFDFEFVLTQELRIPDEVDVAY